MEAQSDTWFVFEQAGQTEAYGYKDKTGKVTVAPIACLIAPPSRFDDIIAVNGAQGFYYLTKAGKKITLGPRIFDNAPDCENEGTIRFTNFTNGDDNTGLLNKNGDIVIPAQYSDMTRAMNGMVVAWKGATRVDSGHDGHYGHTGGELLLLDTHGNTLVENLSLGGKFDFYEIRDGKLDFYTLKISPEPHPDSDRVNFKGVNGQYYSFVDIDRAFNGWLNNLIEGINKDKLANVVGKDVNVTLRREADNKILSLSPVEFVTAYYDVIAAIFLRKNYSVMRADPVMDIYRDNCDGSMGWRFPAMLVYTKSQDELVFQRTERGYRLLEATMRQ